MLGLWSNGAGYAPAKCKRCSAAVIKEEIATFQGEWWTTQFRMSRKSWRSNLPVLLGTGAHPDRERLDAWLNEGGNADRPAFSTCPSFPCMNSTVATSATLKTLAQC